MGSMMMKSGSTALEHAAAKHYPSPEELQTSRPANPSQVAKPSPSKVLSQTVANPPSLQISMSVMLLNTLWPASEVGCDCNAQWPLPRFITETLRRSRTSAHTLHAALYYLFCLKAYSQSRYCAPRAADAKEKVFYLYCGRRTFLTALMLACKFCNDKNYSIAAWAKISGLPKSDLIRYERQMLEIFNYQLWVPHKELNILLSILVMCVEQENSPALLLKFCTPQYLSLVDRQVYKHSRAAAAGDYAAVLPSSTSLPDRVPGSPPLTPTNSPCLKCCDPVDDSLRGVKRILDDNQAVKIKKCKNS